VRGDWRVFAVFGAILLALLGTFLTRPQAAMTAYPQVPARPSTPAPPPDIPAPAPTFSPSVVYPPSQITAAPDPRIAAPEMEQRLEEAVNAIRAQAGLPALQHSDMLARVSRAHSKNMARDQFRGHYDLAGRGAAERLNAAAIPYAAVGENVARSTNYDGAALKAVIDGWMQSAGHRENILSPIFSTTGVGVEWDGTRFYCTQVFVRPIK
jgi:uncharacterized protein YkwD